MSVLSDRWIKKMAIEKEMIKPFIEKQKANKNISYGFLPFCSDTKGLIISFSIAIFLIQRSDKTVIFYFLSLY